MNKISLYLFLVLLYLGLSKGLSPSQQTTLYIENENSLSQAFTGSPLSLILMESIQTGFLITTYFHRYKAIYVFKESEEIIARTSESYWKKNLPHLGLSIFRRDDTEENAESTTPLPPGSLFIGNHSYGSWETTAEDQRLWVFNNAYRTFPEIFYWDDFQPSYEFYQRLKAHEEHKIPFFGMNKEFGTEGSITMKYFKSDTKATERFKFNLFDKVLAYFKDSSKSTPADETAQPTTTPIEEIAPFLGEKIEAPKKEAGDEYE